jgi:tRNA1Val (adenine37-N6)-methyltransferase
MGEITAGTLFGGRITYRQRRDGHRTGFEPVLLAASIDAKPGERVLEGGTGAGAALLCLATRAPGIAGVGLERDPALARLANINFKTNGLESLSCVQGDVTKPPFPRDYFDHVFANPPWFDSTSTLPPDARRALAHHAGPNLLDEWVAALAAMLRPRGSLTLILPAASFAQAAAAMRLRGCAGVTLFPLWSRAGQPAKMVILSARRGAKSPDRVLPGLVLHDKAGITPAAQKILRDGQSTIGVSNTT